MERAKLKAQAKELLKGNYTPLVLGLLVFVAAMMLGSILDAIFGTKYLSSLFAAVCEILFMMGYINCVVKISRKEKTEVENMFKYTHLGLKYLVITLIVGLLVGILSLLTSIAYSSLGTIISNMGNISPLLYILLVVVGILLIAGIIAFMIYLSISFSQVYFILNDKPEEKISDILNESFDMMEGYRLEYFVLVVSFLGWLILGLFTLGILYLWLIPYMFVTFELFYEKVKERYSYKEPLKEEDEEEKPKKPKKNKKQKTEKKEK